MLNMPVVKKNPYHHVKYIWHYKYSKIISLNKFYCHFHPRLPFSRILITRICLWGSIGGCLTNFDSETHSELLPTLTLPTNHYGPPDFKNIKNRRYKLLGNQCTGALYGFPNF